jgi:quinol monooxygenase YgiN
MSEITRTSLPQATTWQVKGEPLGQFLTRLVLLFCKARPEILLPFTLNILLVHHIWRPKKSCRPSLLFFPSASHPLSAKAFPGCCRLFSNDGMPLALVLYMVLIIMHMKVSSQKSKELSQTITSLINLIRMEKGCARCDFFHGKEDENIFYLVEEWDTQNSFERHRRSDGFKVLRGAMNLLEKPCEITSYKLDKKNVPDLEISKMFDDFHLEIPAVPQEKT